MKKSLDRSISSCIFVVDGGEMKRREEEKGIRIALVWDAVDARDPLVT